MTNNKVINQKSYQKLQKEISNLLNKTKVEIKKLANSALADCYWQIGKIIDEEKFSENANYKNLLLQNLEEDLQIDKDTLSKALRFYQAYPGGERRGLSWSHYRRLITITDPNSRQIIGDQAKREEWSVRRLEETIRNIDDEENRGKFKGAVGELGSALVGGNGAKDSSASGVGAGEGAAGLKTAGQIKGRELKRPTDPSYLYKAKIVNVVDGDTLILSIDLGFKVFKEQRARLMQIDAPEMKTAAGKQSHHYLRDLCASIDEVAVKTNKVDIYGRYLVDVFYLRNQSKKGTTQSDIFTKGVYLNARILEDGMATVY